ncbi:MAG: hypothetical protein Q9175_001674 [Cornicularia normoerica]
MKGGRGSSHVSLMAVLNNAVDKVAARLAGPNTDGEVINAQWDATGAGDRPWKHLDGVLNIRRAEWWQRESEQGDLEMANMEVEDRLVFLWTTMKSL